MACLDQLLVLFRYHSRSAPAQLSGILPLKKYFAAWFMSKVPTRRLSPCGGVANLVTDGAEEVGIVQVEPCVQVGLDDRAGACPLRGGPEVRCAGGAWWESEKSPTNQKNSSTPCESGLSGSSSRPHVWKRLRVCDQHSEARVDAKRRCLHLQAEGSSPVHDKMGVG